MIVVIDTNIFVACLSRKSPLYPIFLKLVEGKYSLSVSSEILLEYEEIILQKHGSSTTENFIYFILESPDCIKTDVYYNWQLISKDPDDNKFVDIAVAVGADYLVTNDSHFKELKNLTFPKINIISSTEFLEVVENLK